MNKAKLVELADEVLTDVDVDMQSVVRKELEINLCDKLSDIFKKAQRHHKYPLDGVRVGKNEKSYKAVKPILDDCIDKLLGETK
jgi:hypothetical protein|tara:strand:- start:625 stop:876 length:252 start_codon:yes stop_codon:yes gene_type:complete